MKPPANIAAAFTVPDGYRSGGIYDIMNAAGIAPSDYEAVNFIIGHEGAWCATKWEGDYGTCLAYRDKYSIYNESKGYGLCQSTPAIKMSIVADDWRTNAVTQLKWCSIHAEQYGGWQGAYQHWIHQADLIGHGNW